MECYYCEKGEALKSIMSEICELYNSTVYLYNDQTHKGKCIVVYKEHKTEWFQLEREEQNNFIRAVSETAKALSEIFNADKINYATYGDIVSHLHVHVTPKYKDGPNWGQPFRDDAPHTILSDEEYSSIIKAIRKKLINN